MKERLNLSDEDVLRLLHSLSMAKFKVLGKDPANKTLAKTDTFYFNTKFTSPMRRIRVRSQLVAYCFCCTSYIAQYHICSAPQPGGPAVAGLAQSQLQADEYFWLFGAVPGSTACQMPVWTIAGQVWCPAVSCCVVLHGLCLEAV